MNFEHKVGYLWKSPDEDPGQQKLKLRKCNISARTEGTIRSSGLCEIFTADVKKWIQLIGDINSAFWDVLICFGVRTAFTLMHFLLFSSFSFFLLLSLVSWVSSEGKGLPKCGLWCFQAPDWRCYNWRSVWKGRDCSVQVSEFRFRGFCSNTVQISDKSTSSPSLLIYSWWR